MGDTVFAPLYKVLQRRGVRFEFFHWVTRLGLSADGRFVDAVEYLPQADVTAGEYEPLFDVKGLPCWPSQPDWRQLERGEELCALGVNLERDRNPLGADPVTLRRGEDFDAVVLAIPVGALPEICVELAADAGNPRFRAMLDAAGTVRTQAAQLWLDRTRGELGFAHGSNSIAGAYVEPLDTYCDMTHLAERETWPPGRDQVDVAYFCGVLMESQGDTQAAADAHVRTGVVRYLDKELGPLWPLAAARGGQGFDWSRLLDPNDRSGERRLDAQYLRSNVIGSERYVLTPAGSVQHRLWPDESGYENLYLAGDWTRNNIDGGSVEGAVSSGMLAARALTGSSDRIRGMAGWVWSEGSPRRGAEGAARRRRRPASARAAVVRRVRRPDERPGSARLPGHDALRVLARGRSRSARRPLRKGVPRPVRRRRRLLPVRRLGDGHLRRDRPDSGRDAAVRHDGNRAGAAGRDLGPHGSGPALRPRARGRALSDVRSLHLARQPDVGRLWT
jgi:hypothetical protein